MTSSTPLPPRPATAAAGGFLSRAAITGVYLPALLFEIAMGAITPMVAVAASGLGATLATAGTVAAMLGVGQILADAPAGWFAARVGDRRALMTAALVATVAMIGCALSGSVVLFAVCVLAAGATNATYLLARQAYLVEITPVLYRARALSTLGGVGRVGVFIGPFIGAWIVHLTSAQGVFWFAAGLALVTGVVVMVVPDVEGGEGRPSRGSSSPVSLWSVVRTHRAVFLTLGLAVLLVGSARASRQVVVPLWSEHLGLEPATTSLVYGLSGLLEVIVFYPAGKVMDRRGRLWVAVPSMAALGLAIVLLPLTDTATTIGLVSAGIGAANGLSSGLLMTLGADVAPAGERAQFLGVFRLLQDGGQAAGPLVVSALAAVGSLAMGLVTMGVVSMASAAALQATVPRWSVHANRRTRVAAGLLPDGTTAAAAGTGPAADG